MIRKIIALFLVVACVGGVIAACGDIASDITANVLEAAKEELENQIKEKIEEYKVTVVETKTAFGIINDAGAEHQFYFALLIQTDSEDSASGCANAVGKLFGVSGYAAQTGSEVTSEYLTKQSITYDHDNFEDGNYYTVYVYVEDITKVVDLSAIKDKISNAAASIGK